MRYARDAIGIDKEQEVTILAGNPNVGKSVVYGHLTGKYRDVSNYPGTTVEMSMGESKGLVSKGMVIDTPGADSLTPISEDEKVTRDILLGTDPDQVVQVADAKNLKRALMLFIQISELGLPLILNLNMMDEARTRSIDIDIDGLSKELGVPVLPTVATEGRGISALKSRMEDAAPSQIKVDYPKEIEDAVEKLRPTLKNRGLALLYLSAPDEMSDFIEERLGPSAKRKAQEILEELQSKFSRSLGYVISISRRRKAESIYSEYVEKGEVQSTDLRERLSSLVTQPLTGIPIFIGALIGLYLFVGFVGAQLIVDFIEVSIFEAHVNPWVESTVYGTFGDNVLSEIIAGEYGIVTVGLTWAIALILPIITTFFLAFSVLEDCGYIPRLAAMADKGFRRIGLNGKAVLPMVLGFGCDTMATLTTRVLDTKKERVIATLMLALGIPCSAQLGVIFVIMALLPIHYFFIWVAVIASQLMLVAWLASKIIPGERGDFIMELPPLRIPRWDNVLRKTYYKVVWFLKELVPLFIIGTFIISVMNITGVLDMLINFLEPVVQHWMGLPADATIAFIVGFLRRDFGAAGILAMASQLSYRQMLVATVAITLFIPCIANLLIMVKERGVKTAVAMVVFIIPFAFFVAGVLNYILKIVGL
ncbi:MAG: ferrous iron transport protein B [Candidatus Saliniplasma sp.]